MAALRSSEPILGALFLVVSACSSDGTVHTAAASAAGDASVDSGSLDGGPAIDAPTGDLPPTDLSADIPLTAADASDSSAGDAAADEAPGLMSPLSCAVCSAGFKSCRGQCEFSTGFRRLCIHCMSPSPTTGCNGASCTPCVAPHATVASTCGPGGACAIGSCDKGWGDCDGDPANGCETNLRGTTACGQCGRTCAAGQI